MARARARATGEWMRVNRRICAVGVNRRTSAGGRSEGKLRRKRVWERRSCEPGKGIEGRRSRVGVTGVGGDMGSAVAGRLQNI